MKITNYISDRSLAIAQAMHGGVHLQLGSMASVAITLLWHGGICSSSGGGIGVTHCQTVGVARKNSISSLSTPLGNPICPRSQFYFSRKTVVSTPSLGLLLGKINTHTHFVGGFPPIKSVCDTLYEADTVTLLWHNLELFYSC